MKENATKPTKKKRLLQVLILAVCLLVVAAITVGVIFAVRGGTQELSASQDQTEQKPNDKDTGEDKPGEQDKPEDQENPGGTVDTSSQYEFIMPIDIVEVYKGNEFNWDKTMKWYRLHRAVDFAAPAGTQVFAAVDGTVKSIEKELDAVSVVIEHADGVSTLYRFVDPVGISFGSKVSRGQVIGTVAAATGVENADGDHLHFEIYKDGKLTDPENYLEFESK